MQIFAGKGLAGLLSLLLILAVVLWAGIRVPFRPEVPHTHKLLLLTGAAFGFAFLIYGNVQEVFYVQSLQYLFFAVVFLVASIMGSSIVITERKRKLFLISFLCLFIGHMVWEYAVPGRA